VAAARDLRLRLRDSGTDNVSEMNHSGQDRQKISLSSQILLPTVLFIIIKQALAFRTNLDNFAPYLLIEIRLCYHRLPGYSSLTPYHLRPSPH
jgi:hypothetical protein